MGCDIHMYIEFQVNDGPWEADPHHKLTLEDSCGDCQFCNSGKGLECPDAYISYRQVDATGRDYGLFAIMAGVRGDGRNARGLPSNVSQIIQDASDRYGEDGHNHSYLSLKELKSAIKKNRRENEQTDVPNPRTDAFNDLPYEEAPEDYTTICNYMDKVIYEQVAESHLLSDKPSVVKGRVVFWFDN